MEERIEQHIWKGGGLERSVISVHVCGSVDYGRYLRYLNHYLHGVDTHVCNWSVAFFCFCRLFMGLAKGCGPHGHRPSAWRWACRPLTKVNDADVAQLYFFSDSMVSKRTMVVIRLVTHKRSERVMCCKQHNLRQLGSCSECRVQGKVIVARSISVLQISSNSRPSGELLSLDQWYRA